MGHVDVEIVTRQHAILSASSAERWLTCTPSARIEEALEDTDTAAATDGTAAHAFSEVRLRYLLEQITHPEYVKGYNATRKLYKEVIDAWAPSDWEAIDTYVEYVMSEAKRLDARVLIEARVDYSKYAQGGFGTSDALLWSPSLKLVKSIDLKFGKGVAVYADDNPQAKLYALGGLLKLPAAAAVEQVEWAIHQPRLDYVGEDSMSAAELIDWAETVVRPAAELAWKGEGKLVPSLKGCRFCKAAATCRARAAENTLIAMRDFGVLPDVNLDEHLMGMDEVATLLPKLDEYIAWANKVKAYALEQARDHEAEIPGYKVVRGRANRAYVPGVDVPEVLKSLGVSETDIFVSKEPEVRSPTQLEKQLGKKKYTEITGAAKLVHVPLGTPTLVPERDKRPSMNKASEAAKAFGVDE